MPDVHRMGDCNEADGCVDEIPENITVFVNGLLAVVKNSEGNVDKKGHKWKTRGVEDVFIHNIPVTVRGLGDTCKHLRACGSPNVFVNSRGGSSFFIDNTGLFTPLDPPPDNGTNGSTQMELENTDQDDPEDSKEENKCKDHFAYEKPSKIIETVEGDAPKPTPVYGCDQEVPEIPEDPDEYDTFAQSFQLSPNFTLYDLTVGPAVSTYRLSPDGNTNIGMSAHDIIANLCNLAKSVLEPMKAHLPDMFITSGYRDKAGKSQHNKGQAVDIQVGRFSTNEYWEEAVWIKDNIPFDQFIMELFGRNPWYHLSANSAGNRGQVLTAFSSTDYRPGLVRVLAHP